MVHPIFAQYAISVIQKENNCVSLHLIHTFGENMDYLSSFEFYKTSPSKRGTWLEHTTLEEFPFANPMIAKTQQEADQFVEAATLWAINKVRANDEIENISYHNHSGGYDGDMLIS